MYYLISLWDEDRVKEDIQALKQACDLVIIYPHWGLEYESTPSDRQVELGRSMANCGADIIIGSHPHVVQPAEIFQTKDGRQALIAYSCGNFLSAQNLENNGDIRLEQGLAYEIEVSKNLSQDQVYLSSVKAHPLWVGRRLAEVDTVYKVHLCSDYLNGAGQLDEPSRARLEEAYAMTMETLDNFEYTRQDF